MSTSSGRLVGKMKWMVARYPKPPGQLITLGAVLYDPEEPESRLNWDDRVEVDPRFLLDESLAVRGTIQMKVSSDDSIMLKVIQLLLGNGLSIYGHSEEDRKMTVDALDVSAKIFLPNREYMDASMEAPGIQEYIKKSNFSKTLYVITGVATANKLIIAEETLKQDRAGIDITATDPGAIGLKAITERMHNSSATAISKFEIDSKCVFAYRVREFTYWKHRREKVKMKSDRSAGALFGVGNDNNDYPDSDDDNLEIFAVFNELKDDDGGGHACGLWTMEI